MSNPFFNYKTLEKVNTLDSAGLENTMTVQGAIAKSTILFLTLVATAFAVWWKFGGSPEAVNNLGAWMWGSAIGGFAIVMIAIFKKEWSPVLAPIYAVVEGVFVAVISMVYNYAYPGIITQAVTITFLILGIMLFSYRMGWLRATPMFKKVIIYATTAIGIFYLIMIVGGLFGATGLSTFYAGSSPLSIGISAVIAGIAAFNLILYFDMIEKGAENNLPDYMEWFSGMSLLITVVWLYLEILRLISKLRD